MHLLHWTEPNQFLREKIYIYNIFTVFSMDNISRLLKLDKLVTFASLISRLLFTNKCLWIYQDFQILLKLGAFASLIRTKSILPKQIMDTSRLLNLVKTWCICFIDQQINIYPGTLLLHFPAFQFRSKTWIIFYINNSTTIWTLWMFRTSFTWLLRRWPIFIYLIICWWSFAVRLKSQPYLIFVTNPNNISVEKKLACGETNSLIHNI